MKKIFAGLLGVVALICTACVLMVGCKGEETVRPEWQVYNGVYKFEKLESVTVMQLGEQEQTLNNTVEVGQTYGGLVWSEETIVITLNEDGTALWESKAFGTPSSSSGEVVYDWKVEDGVLYLTITNSTTTMEIDDEKIIYSVTTSTGSMQMSAKYYIKKV